MKLLFIYTIFPQYLCYPLRCLAIEQSCNTCTYIKTVQKIHYMQGIIYVQFSINFSKALTYVNYYISANQRNGVRHTLKCFTELRTKQVIQTIPSLELCCGSADSFRVVESLTVLVVLHFIEYPFRARCLFISLYLYILFLNRHNSINYILRLLKNMAVSVDLTFVFCSHVQTSAAKLIKTYSSL